MGAAGLCISFGDRRSIPVPTERRLPTATTFLYPTNGLRGQGPPISPSCPLQLPTQPAPSFLWLPGSPGRGGCPFKAVPEGQGPGRGSTARMLFPCLCPRSLHRHGTVARGAAHPLRSRRCCAPAQGCSALAQACDPVPPAPQTLHKSSGVCVMVTSPWRRGGGPLLALWLPQPSGSGGSTRLVGLFFHWGPFSLRNQTKARMFKAETLKKVNQGAGQLAVYQHSPSEPLAEALISNRREGKSRESVRSLSAAPGAAGWVPALLGTPSSAAAGAWGPH